MRSLALAILVVLSLGLLPNPGAAEPQVVTVGTYIQQIQDLSLRDGKVTVDFYLWARWKGEELDPLATLEVMNGQLESRDVLDRKMIGDEHYAQGRMRAILNVPWDVTNFPLDTQRFSIAIEDSVLTTKDLRIVADTENTAYSPQIVIPGYRIAGSRTKVSDYTYKTNYGDVSLPTGNASAYARFEQEIVIDRPSIGYFFKLFGAVFISSLVAFLAFLVKPNDLDPRFGLGVGSIFAVVACAFVVSSQLPESSEFTLADYVNLISLGTILLTIVQSAISLMIFERNPARARALDRVSFGIFPPLYFFAIAAAASATA
jgi:hypothetical protein